MTHCRGCGAGARQVPSRKFVHLIGCGWRMRVEKGKPVEKSEDRATPSAEKDQKRIIRVAYEAALVAKDNNETMDRQVDAFVDKLLDRLDEENND